MCSRKIGAAEPSASRKTVSMARDHSLRKERNAEDLKWMPRPKKHSNGKPGPCVTVKGRKENEQDYLYPQMFEKW